MHGITATATNTQHPDAALIHKILGHQIVHRTAEVLHPGRRVFQKTGLATTFPLEGRIKRQRHIPHFRQPGGIDRTGGLLLAATDRVRTDNRGVLPGRIKAFREVQIGGHIDITVLEAHSFHGLTLL